MRAACHFPNPKMRAVRLARQVRTERDIVAFHLEIKHGNIDVRSNMRVRRNYAAQILREPIRAADTTVHEIAVVHMRQWMDRVDVSNYECCRLRSPDRK